MDDHHSPKDLIQRLMQWGKQHEPIRAVLLTSSRAIPDAAVDPFSDYDIVLVVTDIRPFYADRSWLEHFGRVLVLYQDPILPDPQYGFERFCNVTQYEDGLKIDFTLWPIDLLRKIADDPQLPPDLDIGYNVLLDKDQLTDRMQPPSYRAYIPTPPTLQEFQTVVETFFSDAPYVAKNLWRDELLPAKYSLDYIMKQKYLRRMLEWRMEIDVGWAVKTGTLGRGLKKRLPAELWSNLENTFVGAEIEENWDALFRTIDIFRRAALEVANDLGYRYPGDLHERVVAYLWKVKRLARDADSFS